MTSLFRRPLRTKEEISTHEALRRAEAVARKLENIPEPSAPPYQGHTTASLARHYALVIEITTDLGWGCPKALRYMKHHAREATLTAESFASNWELNTTQGGVGGWNNLPLHTAKMIKGLRTRIYPALTVCDAEFDPKKILRKRHLEIETTHLLRLNAIKCKYERMRSLASSHTRKKIRELERNELQIILDSIAKEICEWEKELNQACKEVGFT